jgi:hypothetical protein
MPTTQSDAGGARKLRKSSPIGKKNLQNFKKNCDFTHAALATAPLAR